MRNLVMRVAYLINQYPKVSHSFIRREIAALESEGIEVLRFSIRRCSEGLVDDADKAELERTRFILDVGLLGLLAGLIRVACTRPVRLAGALRLALGIGWRSNRQMLHGLAYVAEACVLLGWLSEASVDHVHAHFPTNPAMVAMLCRILGGPPYSFTSHGVELTDRPELLGLAHKLARASFAVAVSEFGRSQLYRWCGHHLWPRIRVVRCGLDGAFLNAPRAPVPSAPRLVCVGRLSEEKGQLLLLQAIRVLAAEGVDVKIVLVGDGPLRAEIEELVARFELGRHVEMIGWATSDDVRQQILNSRVLVLPSFAEGLPVVIIEALALGRPVISTYVAGIPELVQPGVCGWLVPAGSLCSLVEAMREALNAPVQQLRAMGRAGAARVAELHDVRTQARKLASQFRNVARERRGEGSLGVGG